MDQVTFDSLEKCIETVTKYYKDMDVFLKLYKGSNSRRIIFGRYHGGVYDNRLDLNDATRQRKTSSKLTDCPFKAKATSSKKMKLWTFKGETVPDHNHEITEHVAGYSSAARRLLTEVEKVIVRDMAKAGVTSSQIQSHLKFKTGNQLTTAREISNEEAAARKEFLNGRSPVQALYDLISSGGYTFKVKLARR